MTKEYSIEELREIQQENNRKFGLIEKRVAFLKYTSDRIEDHIKKESLNYSDKDRETLFNAFGQLAGLASSVKLQGAEFRKSCDPINDRISEMERSQTN